MTGEATTDQTSTDDSESDGRRYDPANAETYGAGELDEGLDSLNEGDHVRLYVTWLTEASGEEEETFEADVAEIPEDKPRKAELDTKGKGTATPPRDGDWYIDHSGTAQREESRTAYSIGQMKVWRANDSDQADA